MFEACRFWAGGAASTYVLTRLPVFSGAMKRGAGAGKSTTINMLTGQLPATGGDAVMLGESVRSPGGMGEIRGNMGVCPQFDVLWNEMTAREHMILFANIKGIATKDEIISEADTLISEVCHSRCSPCCTPHCWLAAYRCSPCSPCSPYHQ